MNKIFCIGHFKTGTTSYSMAMRMLGFRDIHFPLKYAERLQETGDVYWDDREWDSMSNINEVEYDRCDRVYPDSKFVLTTRVVDSWLVSIQKHMATKWPPRLKKLLDWRSEVVFGVPCELEAFDEEHFRKRYIEHYEGVLDYFRGREEQLLVLFLESNMKMESLATFLGKGIPYPRMNVSPGPVAGMECPGIPTLVAGGLKRTVDYDEKTVFLQFEEPVKW